MNDALSSPMSCRWFRTSITALTTPMVDVGKRRFDGRGARRMRLAAYAVNRHEDVWCGAAAVGGENDGRLFDRPGSVCRGAPRCSSCVERLDARCDVVERTALLEKRGEASHAPASPTIGCNGERT
jgi:hypothetical protein